MFVHNIRVVFFWNSIFGRHGGIMLSGDAGQHIHPLTPISRAAISPYSVNGFLTKLGTNIHNVSGHC